MGYESWAPYVNMLFEDYAGGKYACQELDSDKSDKGNYCEERETEENNLLLWSLHRESW